MTLSEQHKARRKLSSLPRALFVEMNNLYRFNQPNSPCTMVSRFSS